MLPNKRWICPASERGRIKKTDETGRWDHYCGGIGRWDEKPREVRRKLTVERRLPTETLGVEIHKRFGNEISLL